MKDFTKFFEDDEYVKLKNYLFNYLNRKRLIKLYSKKYLRNGSLIDIGCGISPVTPFPERTKFIDISNSALKFLKSKGFETIYGSVTKIPLKDYSVDSIFCSEVLEHIKDYKKALKEIHRVLKKEGIVFITVPCWKKYWNMDDEFVGHYRRFEPKEFEKDLMSAGLNIINNKNIGSGLERKLTMALVKNFKKGTKISFLMIYPYIFINYFLSWIVSFTSFVSSKENSSIILFVCKKD